MRKSILIPTLLIALFLLLCPPWREETWRTVGQKAVVNYTNSYHATYGDTNHNAKIDFARLFMELAALAVATGIAYLIFQRKKS